MRDRPGPSREVGTSAWRPPRRAAVGCGALLAALAVAMLLPAVPRGALAAAGLAPRGGVARPLPGGCTPTTPPPVACTPTPTPTAAATATATATAAPSPTSTATPEPAPSATPSPQPSPTPSPTPTVTPPSVAPNPGGGNGGNAGGAGGVGGGGAGASPNLLVIVGLTASIMLLLLLAGGIVAYALLRGRQPPARYPPDAYDAPGYGGRMPWGTGRPYGDAGASAGSAGWGDEPTIPDPDWVPRPMTGRQPAAPPGGGPDTPADPWHAGAPLDAGEE